jgi:hypothetical protein
MRKKVPKIDRNPVEKAKKYPRRHGTAAGCSDIPENLLLGGRHQFRRTGPIDTNEFAFTALVFKFDKALDQSKESVILSAADIIARFPLRSTLPGEYISA